MTRNLTPLTILSKSGVIHRMAARVLPRNGARFFMQAGLLVENIEFFRKTHEYDDWTTRSHMPAGEKARLARFILESSPLIQSYFEVVRRAGGRLDSFTNDFILLKGRKA